MIRIIRRLTGTKKLRLKDMSKTQFVIDAAAVRSEILQADWMKSYIESEAIQQADADSHIKTFIGFDRAKSIIYPNTKEHES